MLNRLFCILLYHFIQSCLREISYLFFGIAFALVHVIIAVRCIYTILRIHGNALIPRSRTPSLVGYETSFRRHRVSQCIFMFTERIHIVAPAVFDFPVFFLHSSRRNIFTFANKLRFPYVPCLIRTNNFICRAVYSVNRFTFIQFTINRNCIYGCVYVRVAVRPRNHYLTQSTTVRYACQS